PRGREHAVEGPPERVELRKDRLEPRVRRPQRHALADLHLAELRQIPHPRPHAVRPRVLAVALREHPAEAVDIHFDRAPRHLCDRSQRRFAERPTIGAGVDADEDTLSAEVARHGTYIPRLPRTCPPLLYVLRATACDPGSPPRKDT